MQANSDEEIEHLCCPAFPNCDIDPQGCFKATKTPTMYGHEDLVDERE